MLHIRSYIIFVYLLLARLICLSQENFQINFAADDVSTIGISNLLENSHGDYVGLYHITVNPDTSSFRDVHLLTISSNGDTSTVRFYKGNDTTLYFSKIFQVKEDPIEYFVFGFYALSDNERWLNEWMLWLDEEFNIIREKKYQLSPIDEWGIPTVDVMRLADGSFVEARWPGSASYMYLFHFSEQGDSLNFRSYESDSAGTIKCLSYSPDSSSIWLHTRGAHGIPAGPQTAVIEINENFEQTRVMYYPRWFNDDFTAKPLPDNKIVVSGKYAEYQWPEDEFEYFIGTYIMDTGLHILHEDYLTHPDTMTYSLPNCMDYFYPNQIYAGGTHNHQFLWSPEPSWIIIAKYDSTLNLLYERYIGGDANYVLNNVCATSDSGVILASYYFDPTDEIRRRKAVIIKLNPDGLLVKNNEYKDNLQVTRAMAYPNPGNNRLFIRSTEFGALLTLRDMNGKVIEQQSIKNLITEINTGSLAPGFYLWSLQRGNKLLASGKWLKK